VRETIAENNMDTDFHDDVNDAPINQTAIQELRDEGEDLLSELVEMFIGEVPGQLATLEEALAKGDAGVTRLIAHTLKGTGGNFGASRMQALASAIEQKRPQPLARGRSQDLRSVARRVRSGPRGAGSRAPAGTVGG
jgi:HPt (histidine-containing phosphotransfer) domain-containing protein